MMTALNAETENEDDSERQNWEAMMALNAKNWGAMRALNAKLRTMMALNAKPRMMMGLNAKTENEDGFEH